MRPLRPLRPMSAVERFLERLLERPSARLFGTPVMPVQLERRIERAMELGQRVEGGRIQVPDRLAVRLSTADLARLPDPSGLATDLASHALSWARRRGYVLSVRPEVRIQADGALGAGDISVDADFSNGGDVFSGPLDDDPTSTRVFRRPIVTAALATLEVTLPGESPRTITANGTPMTVGRGAENDLVLRDDRVSRRHARLATRGGTYVITDLDSTNGIRVNGSRVQEMALGAGDVIEIGATVITVVALEESDLGQSPDEEPRRP